MFGNWRDSLTSIKNDTSLPDSIRLEAQYQLTVKEYNEGKVDRVDVNDINELISMAEIMDDNKYKALGVNSLAIIYMFAGKIDSASIKFDKALELAKRSGDASLVSKIHSNIGRTLIMKGELIEALNHLSESEQLILAINGDENQDLAILYNAFFLIYYSIDDWDNAEYYARKCVESGSMPTSLIGDLSNLGFVLSKKGENEKAAEYLNQALNLCYKHNVEGIIKANAIVSLARVHGKRGEMEIAKQYIKNANEILKGPQMSLKRLMVEGDILDFYETHGMTEKSVDLAERLYNFPVTQTVPLYRKKVTEILFHHYRTIGASNKALDLLDEYLEAIADLKEEETKKEVLRKTLEVDFEKKALEDSLQLVKNKAEMQLAHKQELYKKKRNQNILLGAGFFIVLIAIGFYSRMRTMGKMNRLIKKEHEKSDTLLLNILPKNVAQELKSTGKTKANYIELASILFTDFVDFTSVSDQIRAGELVEELNHFFSSFDKIVQKHGIEKIKTIGDAYMAAGGVPEPIRGSVKKTVLAALEMQAVIHDRKQFNEERGFPSMDMRAGIHSGPVIAGVVGLSKFQYDIWGDTVNVASRLETACGAGKVNISMTTYDLIKDDPEFNFTSRGRIKIKGKADIDMFYVTKANRS